MGVGVGVGVGVCVFLRYMRYWNRNMRVRV